MRMLDSTLVSPFLGGGAYTSWKGTGWDAGSERGNHLQVNDRGGICAKDEMSRSRIAVNHEKEQWNIVRNLMSLIVYSLSSKL